MAANIFGNRFSGARQPAWHGLGTVFTEPKTATEAMVDAGMDYPIEKRPILVPDARGNPVEVPGKVMLVRGETGSDPEAFLGIVGKNYGVIQNRDLAAGLDPLTADWPVETVGALGDGGTVFFTLDAGQTDVAGDAVNLFYLVTDSRGTGRALRIAFTPVRVVCQNTLVTGLNSAVVEASLFHGKNIREEFAFRVDLLAQMKKAQDETLQRMRSMATTRLVEDQVTAILEAAYPMPKAPKSAAFAEAVRLLGGEDFVSADRLASIDDRTKKTVRWVVSVNGFRDGARSLYERFNDEFPASAGTPWAVYNAVVETEDYRRGKDTAGEQAMIPGNYRADAKARAFAAAAALV